MKDRNNDVEMNEQNDEDLDIQALFQKYLDDTVAEEKTESEPEPETETELALEESDTETSESEATEKKSGGFFARLLHMVDEEEPEISDAEEEDLEEAPWDLSEDSTAESSEESEEEAEKEEEDPLKSVFLALDHEAETETERAEEETETDEEPEESPVEFVTETEEKETSEEPAWSEPEEILPDATEEEKVTETVYSVDETAKETESVEETEEIAEEEEPEQISMVGALADDPDDFDEPLFQIPVEESEEATYVTPSLLEEEDILNEGEEKTEPISDEDLLFRDMDEQLENGETFSEETAQDSQPEDNTEADSADTILFSLNEKTEDEPKEAPPEESAENTILFSSLSREVEEDLDDDGFSPDELPKKDAEPVLDEKELVDSDEDVDNTDINLMVAFGLDDELNQTIGFEKADRIREKIETSSKVERREPVDFEFTDRIQSPGIASAYKSNKRVVLIKMIVAFAAAAYLLFYENISVIGVQFSGFLDPVLYPVTYVMIALEIGLIACACAYEQIIQGFSKLFKGRPSCETVLSVFLVCNVLYSVLICLTSAKSADIQLYNAPLALCAAVSLLHDYLAMKREICSFNVVASRKPKYVLRRIPAQEAAPETSAANSDSDVLKIEKTSFVDGFFSRICTNVNSETPAIGFFCMMIPVFSVLVGVVGSLMSTETHPIRIAGSTFALAFPTVMILLYSYPLFRAVRLAYNDDTTMVGEYSLHEYADATLMSMDEAVLFPDENVRIQNILVYNNYRLDKVLFFAASVFSKTGGPLGRIIGNAAEDIGSSDNVVLKRIAHGLIVAEVDGKSVSFGSAEAFIAAGYPDVFPEENDEEEKSERIMYMFREDVLVAQIQIQYILNPEFSSLLSDMIDSGLDICIRSFDPNIDKRLIMDALNVTNASIHIVKFASSDKKEETQERVDAGIVSRGDPNGLLQALSYCDETLNVLSVGEKMMWAATLLGAFGALVLVFLGSIGVVNSLIACLYQALWMIPVAVLGNTKIH